MRLKSCHGSFIAENTAVMVLILLGLIFPLINLATSTYRYNMVYGAAKAAAHAASSAPTFTGTAPSTGGSTAGGPSSLGPGMAQVVPSMVNNYLQNARGIQNVKTNYRINQATIATQAVTHTPWATKLSIPPDPQTYMYSVEVNVQADVYPLVTMSATGIIPNVPGLTGPTHQNVSAQEVVETVSGLNQ